MMDIIKGPWLQWPTSSTVTVMWETGEPSRGSVEWFATEALHAGLEGRAQTLLPSRRVATESEAGRIHRVTIEGLAPDREYHYRIVEGSAPDGEPEALHSVFAAAPADRPFCFAVTSETGGFGDDEINRRLFAQMEQWRPDMLLVVGDAVRDGRSYDDWERYFFGPARRLLHSTPFYLCPGNHEENADWMYQFTAFPSPHYGFDYGNVHFTALDSTRLVEYVEGVPQATEQLDETSPQREFLRQDLAGAGAAARWRIVFFHYPPYVSSDYEVEQMRTLVPDLEAGGVDLVFNSHSIVYERSHPLKGGRYCDGEGIVYVVAGGAGAKPEWFHPKKAAHTAQALAVPHFVHVVVAGSTMEAKAIDVDGRVFDSWQLTK